MRKVFWLVALVAALVLAGCASTGPIPVSVEATVGDYAVSANGVFDGSAEFTALMPVTPTAGSPAAGATAVATPAPAGEVCDALTSWTPEVIINSLVPNPAERAFVAIPQQIGDLWLVQTAKTAFDGDGHPCCGPVITFRTFGGGQFDYWNDSDSRSPAFNAPTGTGFTATAQTDPNSGHSNWEVLAQQGSSGTFKSDGVSWTPCPAGTSASAVPAATATPAASAPAISLGGLSEISIEEAIAWTGITGWVVIEDTDPVRYYWEDDSPVQICFTPEFPEGAYLLYGVDPDGDGNWDDAYVTQADSCTENEVDKATLVPGFPER
ncbi:hypothetical protein COY16_01100 [Candidatus Roizmanbacteria bacterium CG_4_10_14_0_2_um_filter_39_13]|uniref:Uncharacterized protein n=1 Tax=Candidatus Roizmanbacteria bacterium CG_4_10_14_0_2_um_filter_39_13 TaxID=1974825 RepID=A0A2M7U160_9BACT|nr:MAG: hypothetical protein COY16_01100 [Candidatus Roizmanbacteria bacterium CG_4_10_14_0_2_um_filter_39_13]